VEARECITQSLVTVMVVGWNAEKQAIHPFGR
jgi:hypothetical protein